MEITGSEYSDNYTEGQVMGQDILAGTVVKKWSTVGEMCIRDSHVPGQRMRSGGPAGGGAEADCNH